MILVGVMAFVKNNHTEPIHRQVVQRIVEELVKGTRGGYNPRIPARQKSDFVRLGAGFTAQTADHQASFLLNGGLMLSDKGDTVDEKEGETGGVEFVHAMHE